MSNWPIFLHTIWFNFFRDKMIADFLTKPLQGKVFQKFRDVLMGAVSKWYDID